MLSGCQPHAPHARSGFQPNFTPTPHYEATASPNNTVRGRSLSTHQQYIAIIRYRKLRKVRDEIRLLTIIDDESEPITCKLEHVSLSASPSFKALSYCWGDANDTRPVTINGCTVAVTVNLESALRQFRAEFHGWIWIDALCINQSDLEEKGEQVLRMGDIFSKAVEVIAWLGPERNDSDRAMQFMRTIGEHVAEALSKESELHWGKPVSREECRADDDDSWWALECLFRRDYWTRL